MWSSCWSCVHRAGLYRVAADMPRHDCWCSPPMPTRVDAAPPQVQRNVLGTDRRRRSPGRSAAARRRRPAVRARRAGRRSRSTLWTWRQHRRASARRASAASCRRRPAAGRPGPCRPARPCAGSRPAARRSSPSASPSNDATNPARAATPPLIASEAKWSSSTTSAARTPGTALTRVVGVGHHEEREVRRTEVGRQPQPDRASPSVGDGARRDEAERGDRLVQLRVAHRLQRGQHPRPDRSRRALGDACPVLTIPSGGRPARPECLRRRRAGTRPAPRCRRASPR